MQQTKQLQVERNIKYWKIFYIATLFLGLVLMLFEISIYRKTIIPFYLPFSIILLVGIIAFFLVGKHYKTIYLLSGNFFTVIQNLFSWGAIACYLFMASNYYLADPQTTIHRFAIEKKSSMPGPKGSRSKRQPLATINYFGFAKELVFHYSDTDQFDNSKNINVSVKKGGLGFDVLDDYWLD